MLRDLFQRDPAILSEPYHATHEISTLWLRERADNSTGQPSLVVAMQSFRDYLLLNSHAHVIATARVFTAAGTFHLAETGD
jgi:hypothetical protein